MSLSRRYFLIAGVPFVNVATAGCLSTDGGTEEDEMIFHEGERLVSVAVEEGFSKEIVIKADCRDDDITVAPGESFTLYREENGEECSVRLFTDGDELYSVMIYDYAAYELTVTENGDVEQLGAER